MTEKIDRDPAIDQELAHEGARQSETSSRRSSFRRFSQAERDQMYTLWRGGERNLTELARKFETTFDTVHKYVNKGIPARGIPSFIVRQQTETQTAESARVMVTEKIASQIADEFAEVRRAQLEVHKRLRVVCAVMVNRLMEQLKAMSWTRMVTVYEISEDGRQLRRTVERGLDAFELANVARAVSQALALSGKMESLWLGGPTERVENIPESEKLSDAELDWVTNHEGEMPPGMTPETFLRKMSRTWGLSLPDEGGEGGN